VIDIAFSKGNSINMANLGIHIPHNIDPEYRSGSVDPAYTPGQIIWDTPAYLIGYYP